MMRTPLKRPFTSQAADVATSTDQSLLLGNDVEAIIAECNLTDESNRWLSLSGVPRAEW